MSKPGSQIGLLVVAVTLAALVALVASWHAGLPYPGAWAFGSFLAVAFLLDQTSNPLRVEATGSTSFIIHISAALLFGGFWGGLVTGISTGVDQLFHQQSPVKTLFNVSQRILCVCAGWLLYTALGGGTPPTYLELNASVQSVVVQRDLGLFFILAGLYFTVNTVAVNAAIAISSGRSFREVWNLNAKGVLGYDLGGSAIAILVAYLFRASEHFWGFGPIGLFGVIVPIVVIRHIYGMYRRLQTSGRELLDLMVKAIEARDPYTSGHSIRVATLAKAIAQECEMAADEVEGVYTAALLHDVGKIHEEFAPLLRKETKLTPEETAILQTHAVKSAELVGIISSFRGMVQDAVRSHHERWDGGGYPDGLVGEAIPLGARIIMISDTTDAMTTDRPYRKRLTVDAVIAEFQKHRETQFDPALVDLTINSVGIRRVISDLQSITTSIESGGLRQGGSHKVHWRSGGIWRAPRVSGKV